MAIIDPAQEEFLEKTKIELSDVNNQASIKTNFFILQKNKLTLVEWLTKLLGYIRYLRKLIDTDTIVTEIFDYIQEHKYKITIKVPTGVTTILDSSNGKNFTITYVDDYTVNVECLDKLIWQTNQLVISVKTTNEGIVVYPVITCKNNMIIFNFADGIGENYDVYFI
jgi:hypothetical protein